MRCMGPLKMWMDKEAGMKSMRAQEIKEGRTEEVGRTRIIVDGEEGKVEEHEAGKLWQMKKAGVCR